MVVLLHANSMGFGALEIACMFITYEIAGIVTNLFGGHVASNIGLAVMLAWAMILQIVSLGLLLLVEPIFGDLKLITQGRSAQIWWTTIYITAVLTLGGVAKDFMKLTGKAAPKLCTKEGDDNRLFKLVSMITGSKNALKGSGHFLGALLIASVGYEWSIFLMITIIAGAALAGKILMDR